MNSNSPPLQPQKVKGNITLSNERIEIDQQAVPSQEPPEDNSEIVLNLRKGASRDIFPTTLNESH